MRAPLSWLRDFVPIDVEPDALAERLSLSGLTVEQVIRTGGSVTGVVVGEVRAMREHPNADKLMLVKAFDGTQERDIVCGARNYVVGDRVPMALPGAKLPDGMEIARREVRGETSDGMLCSAKELQIADDHSGILILDRDAPLGRDIVDVLDLSDAVFEFDITTNRGDLLSITGIAREIAALYDLPFTIPAVSVPEGDAAASSQASVEVADAKGCPRYVARIFSGVTIGPSPWWMRRRLLACGMRPISNVVDVTNYVLLERGQPLHAFDLDKLSGSKIVVRKPRKGEGLTTLDGQPRVLDRNDVVICDAERPVAVAGVMGGADSEVSATTTRILLESATFDPIRVRTTAARLGLRTEASARFEKGSDPALPPLAADRAAALLAELTGATVARGAIDVYAKPVKQKPIKLRTARASMLIGAEQATPGMAKTLRALGCDVHEQRSSLKATPPTWRPDLREEVDLIEEVARYHGFENVEARLPTGARTGGLTDRQRARRLVSEVLLGAGLSEAQTLSLLPPGLPDRLALPDDHPLRSARRVGNPLSEEESVLRVSLLPGLMLAAQRNAARRVLPVTLFEIGVVFQPDDPVDERWEVAWVMTGPASSSWHAPERPLDFFDTKGVLERLMDALGVRDLRLVVPEHAWPSLNPGRHAQVLAGEQALGWIGELHPRAAEAFELPERVAVCFLDLDCVLDSVSSEPIQAPPRLPSVTRDVALVVPSELSADDVVRAVRAAAGPSLETIELFDVYRGDPVPDGSVSLAFALAFRDAERTLTDADVDAAMVTVAEAARSRDWSIRD